MSFVVTVPEAVAAAAGDLAAIGSTLREATAAAAGPTTGLAAAAADDVSIAVSQLFGRYGQEFQTVSNQLAAFHTEFVRTLNRGAAAYLNTESANGGQLFGQIEAGQRAVSAAAAAAPGGAYGQLVANTATNLESLYGAWSANPFPFLRQIIANQQVYWQQIAAALANAVQNFPALVANLPAAIDAAVQQFLAFNAAYYIQQIISSQIGFAQLFATTVGQGVTSVIAGWPNLAAELQLAFQQLLVGDYNAAVANLGKAMTNLLVTGFDTSDVTIGTMGTTISVTAKPKLLGPLGDLFTIMTIPAQEAQYFTNLMPPSILRDMSQNFTNVLTTLSNPNIQAVASFDIATTAGTLSTFFGVPLVLTYATLGAPFASLNAIATSAETIEQALLAGNYLGAVGALIDAPAHALDGFLNSATVLDTPILVPTGLPSPLPPTVGITLHLPFDGILVPPHPVTATISFPGAPVPIPGFPTTVTVFGTPFMGMAPLLINYFPNSSPWQSNRRLSAAWPVGWCRRLPCQAPTMRLAAADLPPRPQPRRHRVARPMRSAPRRSHAWARSAARVTTCSSTSMASISDHIWSRFARRESARGAGSVTHSRATKAPGHVGHARTTSAPAPARRRPRYWVQ